MEPVGIISFFVFVAILYFLFIADQRTLRIYACYLPTWLCFIGAFYLLVTGVAVGWGWLLFIGLLCFPSGDRLERTIDE